MNAEQRNRLLAVAEELSGYGLKGQDKAIEARNSQEPYSHWSKQFEELRLAAEAFYMKASAIESALEECNFFPPDRGDIFTADLSDGDGKIAFRCLTRIDRHSISSSHILAKRNDSPASARWFVFFFCWNEGKMLFMHEEKTAEDAARRLCECGGNRNATKADIKDILRFAHDFE